MATMMTCEEATSFTDTELRAIYPNEKGISLLPSTEFSTADRDSKGQLTDARLTMILTDLKARGILPPISEEKTTEYQLRSKALFQNITAEYCHYEKRYMYSLKQLFAAIRSQAATQATATTPSPEIQKFLALSTRLNQTMNDLVRIISRVTREMRTDSQTIQTEMTSINAQLERQQKSLEEQRNLIRSNEGVMKIQKQMVNYSSEKARRTDNLLSLYSVLNIVALGLLVYVYRAAGDE